MPSRRQFLASSGTAVVGSLGGCLSLLGLTNTGSVERKALVLEWEDAGTAYRDEVMDLRFELGSGKILGEYDPSFVDSSVRRPAHIAVSGAVHDRLSDRFDVRYLLGICGSDFAEERESHGCLNTWTSRSDFNRVQLGDRAEVRESNHRFDVVGVEEDAYAVDSTDVRTFDFAAHHRDDGVNPDEW